MFFLALLTSLAINAGIYLLTGLITPSRKVDEGKPNFPTSDPEKYLPWIFGTVRLPINVFRTGRVYSDVNLKKRLTFGLPIGNISDVVSRRYYYTLAGWLCHGPLTGICDVIIDGKYFLSRIPNSMNVTGYTPSTYFDAKGNAVTTWTPVLSSLQPLDTMPLWVGFGKRPTGEVLNIQAPTLFGPVVEQGGVQGIIRVFTGDGSANAPSSVLNDVRWKPVGDPLYEEPPYPEYAYIVLEDLWMGNTGNPPGIEMVVSRATAKLGMGNPLQGIPNSPFGPAHNGFAQGDADPVGTIYELLVDRKLGIGFPRALIDVFSFQSAYGATGFGVSGGVFEQGAAEDTIKQLLAHIDAVLFMHPSTGLLTIALIREFTGDPMTLPLLDDSNLLDFDWAETVQNDTVNEVVVEFTNVYRNLTTDVVRVQNLAGIQRAQRINSQKLQFPYFTQPDQALEAGQRELRVMSSKFGRGNFTANRTAMLLTPGQHVRVTSAKHGLTNVVCRVGAIDIGSLADGKVTGTLMQDRWASEPSAYVAPPSSDVGTPTTVIQPPDVDASLASDTTTSVVYNLVIADYSGAMTAVEYAIQYGNGAMGAWTPLTGPPYVLEVLKTAQSFRAFWRVSYTDVNGVTQYINGEFPQPVSAIDTTAPQLSYVYSGTNVVITADPPTWASGVKFASSTAGPPSDATVLAAAPDTTIPYSITVAAPTGSQVLYVGAAATDGTTDSKVARLQIQPEPVSVAGAEVLLNGSDPSFPAGRDVNDSATIQWDWSTANIATAEVKDNSLDIVKLNASGTRDGTTFLRGDNTFSPVPQYPGPGGAMQVYQTVVKTTGTLADGASQVIILDIAPTVAFQKVQVSAASWVEVYPTAAACGGDAGRAITDDPSWSSANKPIFETAGGLGGYPLTTELDFDNRVANNGDTPRAGRFYMRVTNKSGGSAAITVTITYLPLEGDPGTVPPDVTGGGMLWRFNAQSATPQTDNTEILTVPNTGSLGGNWGNSSGFGSGPRYWNSILNGKPGIRFTQIGGNTRAYSSPGTIPTITEVHVFAILKTAGGGSAWMYGADRTAMPNAAGNVSGWGGSNAEHLVPITNDPTSAFLFYEHGKAGLYEADVGLTNVFSTATNTFAISQYSLGGHLAGGFFANVFEGDLYEVRVYSGPLTSDDKLGIKLQMSSDWGGVPL